MLGHDFGDYGIAGELLQQHHDCRPRPSQQAHRTLLPNVVGRMTAETYEHFSTRPAPHKGLLSSAARKARSPKPPCSRASSTVVNAGLFLTHLAGGM
ncbi:MAG: hypothetical protein JWO59_424 [Chloroflexi bacterium]|nr:hypothetical protein [Chloroflexota bacterium]